MMEFYYLSDFSCQPNLWALSLSREAVVESWWDNP